MDTTKLQNLTKAYHQTKSHNEAKAVIRARKKKTDAYNDEKAQVKQTVLNTLAKITSKDLEDVARNGGDSYVVYENNLYTLASKMNKYINKLVDQLNKEMNLPAKLMVAYSCKKYPPNIYMIEYIHVCSIRYTW